VDEHKQLFAENLRRYRRRTGLSQEQLGFRCGLHRTEISLLENSDRDPRLATIVRLARGLEIPAAALLEGIR
jgi:transcriptional regulator with XRE-family HTH domain